MIHTIPGTYALSRFAKLLTVAAGNKRGEGGGGGSFSRELASASIPCTLELSAAPVSLSVPVALRRLETWYVASLGLQCMGVALCRLRCNLYTALAALSLQEEAEPQHRCIPGTFSFEQKRGGNGWG